MSDKSSPSFSRGRRWAIFFSVVVSMVAVAAVVVMVNYLGARYFVRGNLSSVAKMELSPLTLSLLRSVTNDVKVTIYYDRDDPLYSFVTALLDEYRLANPKISVRSVDYNRDATEAVKVASTYNLVSSDAKNLVIFECDKRCQILDGKLLSDIDYAAVPNDTQPEFERKIKAFKGEQAFSEAIMRVTHPKALLACFLTGHLEHPLNSDSNDGYSKFANELSSQYNIKTSVITLAGTNTIPADCMLLIIAGPQRAIPADELEKIRQHLTQGGRLFVMFRYQAAANKIVTGLEPLLAEWGVGVGMNWYADPDNSVQGAVMIIKDFNPNHPLVKPLAGKYKLGLLLPRLVQKLGASQQSPEGLKVDELAFTGKVVKENDSDVAEKGPFSLMVAVEKGNPKGVFTERGSTRILAVGDSMFLSNQAIPVEDNASFAALAADWLLNQHQFEDGIGPQKVQDSSIRMTRAQLRTVSWIFLGAMPGGVLLLGGLVWLRRRH